MENNMKVIDLHKALGVLIEQGKGDYIAVAYCDHGQWPEEISTPTCEHYIPSEQELVHPDDIENYSECVPCVVLGG